MEYQQLPIQYTVVSALKLVQKNWLTLMLQSSPFLVVNLYFTIGVVDFDDPQQLFTLTNVIVYVLYAVTAAMATVRLHRLVLLGEKSCRLSTIFYLSSRELRFIGWWAALGAMLFAILIIPMFIIGSLANIVTMPMWLIQLCTYAAMLPIGWFISRWSLVLPATALDHQPRGLSVAWQMSKPHAKALFVLIGVIPMLINALLQPLFNLHFLPLTLLLSLVWLVVCAVEICVLSLSFQWIVQREAITQNQELRIPEFTA